MKTRNITLAAISAVLAASACEGSSTAFSDTGIALDEVPAKYAAELCAAYESCVSKEVYALFTNGSDCAEQIERRLLNGEFPQYQALIDAGRMRYDGTKVQACLDALRAKTCETLNERPIPACDAALDGTVALGGACDLSGECEGAAFCQAQAGTCPGQCVAPLVAGQDCAADDQCASGLSCSSETQKCVRPTGLGQPCELGAPPCAAGLLCIGKDNQTSGTCRTPDETFSAAEGAACDPQSQLCSVGLSCAIDTLAASGATFKCVKTGAYAAGSACKLAFPEACPTGNYCKAPGATLVVDGSCAPAPGVGEACGSNLLRPAICAPGTVCVAGKCQSLVENGVSCFGNAMCYSEHCAANGCQAKLPCD